MKRLILAAAVVAALASFSSGPALAAKDGQAMLCAGDVAANSNGSRTVGGTLSQVPSGAIYTLNSQGCGVIKAADIGYFLSQGFTYAGDGGVIVFNVPVAATGTTSYLVGTLPAGAYIKGIYTQDSDASHAVTGGITCGVSAADTSIVGTAQAIGTSSVGFVTDAHLLLRNFSTTAVGPIYCQAVTSWNTPTTVTITIPYGFF